MNQVSIIMYHYVRELPLTRYPGIKGLLLSQFREQLVHIKKHYTFVTVQDCLRALDDESVQLPLNSVLLTFDDAYSDHYLNVFPILDEEGIQGCFFPPARAIQNHEVLDVNKIHFILAAAPDISDLTRVVRGALDRHRAEHNLESNEFYHNKLAHASRYDAPEVIYIKRLLQVELDQKLSRIIIDELFRKYITSDEVAFSRELYMNIDQLKCMARNGMYVGSHGYDHYWLNNLTPEQQEKEIDLSCLSGTPV